jgi:hypothetical protein
MYDDSIYVEYKNAYFICMYVYIVCELMILYQE